MCFFYSMYTCVVSFLLIKMAKIMCFFFREIVNKPLDVFKTSRTPRRRITWNSAVEKCGNSGELPLPETNSEFTLYFVMLKGWRCSKTLHKMNVNPTNRVQVCAKQSYS